MSFRALLNTSGCDEEQVGPAVNTVTSGSGHQGGSGSSIRTVTVGLGRPTGLQN